MPFRARSTSHEAGASTGPTKKAGQNTRSTLSSGEILEGLKAVNALLPEYGAQLINYLRAIRKHVGYLINFGAFPRLEWKRLVLCSE